MDAPDGVAAARNETAATGANAPTRLSAPGTRFIARFEGFSSKLYNDAGGNCTIGFGHLVHQGPINGSEPDEFCKGISEERALALLDEDASAAAAAVRASVNVPLTQPQFDALVSFTYNVGAGALRGSTLLRVLSAGHYHAVPAQLARWTKVGGRTLQGLVKRRAAEGELFAHGRY